MARRRGQRKGYLYRRGPSWFVQYRTDSAELDESGKFKRPTETKYVAAAEGPGKVGRKRAERIAWDEYLSKLDQVNTKPLSSKTVAEFVKERFEPDVVWRCKPSGKAHYGNMLKNHVIPALGDFRLRDLRPQHIQDLMRAKLDHGKAVQTAVHVRNTISAIFRHAKRCQAYAGDLPTEGVRLPALQVAEKRALSWVQVKALAACIGHADPEKERRGPQGPKPDLGRAADLNAQLGALVIILAVTGLRIGEAMGLRWKRVNLADKPVMIDGEMLPAYAMAIRENYVRGKYGTLKTRKSRRNIPLTAEVLVAFGKLKPCAPEAPVFASRNGTPLDQHNVAARFLRPAGKRKDVGCPWVSWHVLRHTAATLADQVGMTVSERQKILGHASASMTGHYTHAELDRVREQMEKIGRPN